MYSPIPYSALSKCEYNVVFYIILTGIWKPVAYLFEKGGCQSLPSFMKPDHGLKKPTHMEFEVFLKPLPPQRVFRGLNKSPQLFLK
jgi:hypothetical protein